MIGAGGWGAAGLPPGGRTAHDVPAEAGVGRRDSCGGGGEDERTSSLSLSVRARCASVQSLDAGAGEHPKSRYFRNY